MKDIPSTNIQRAQRHLVVPIKYAGDARVFVTMRCKSSTGTIYPSTWTLVIPGIAAGDMDVDMTIETHVTRTTPPLRDTISHLLWKHQGESLPDQADIVLKWLAAQEDLSMRLDDEVEVEDDEDDDFEL